MRLGFFMSLVLHLVVIGLVYVVMPAGWKPTLNYEAAVPIEIIREAELAKETSVPAMRKEQEPIKQPEQPPLQETPAEPIISNPETVAAEVKPEEKVPPPPAITPEEKKPAITPEEKKPEEKKPDEIKKPEIKPEIKPTVKPKDELDFDALDSALKDLDPTKDRKSPQSSPSAVPGGAQTGERNQDQVGVGDKLTASEEAKLRAAMYECWSPDIGAKDAGKLIVRVEVRLNRDGSINDTKVLNGGQINASGNVFWKVAEANALRAVRDCAPYAFLSPERYNIWQDVEINFDPKEMAGG